ncbi:MAG TPA: hypothetical protein VMH39_04855 [Gemmatimonadaceae bacterium]|nr:hypothetical protein [Gemmatimonadaceae bacterium]
MFLAAFQLASALTLAVAAKDSAKLVDHVRNEEFLYIMDWRHEWEGWRTSLYYHRESIRRTLDKEPAPPDIRWPAGDWCGIPNTLGPESFQIDLDQHEWSAHLILPPARGDSLPVCPSWVSPLDTFPMGDDKGAPLQRNEGDMALALDSPLNGEYRDTVRARRVPLLKLLDSAARMLPGDPWLAGQRVRMHVNQEETAAALRATVECRAAAWWCLALRGYVRYSAHDITGAEAVFDSSENVMPGDTLCRWNDVSVLLVSSARAAYRKMSCAQQDGINKRVWWLADPLFLVPGNERRVADLARRVMAELEAENDADEWEDMRPGYTGPAVKEMLVRYGRPNGMAWWPPERCTQITVPQPVGFATIWQPPPMCINVVPPGWSRFDTRATYLGLTGVHNEPHRAIPEYSGPQYHTIPDWSAITDPFHSKPADWDLGPELLDSLAWDSSWWAPEFYERYQGPLVDLSTQIAFIRRHASAVVAAAMEWAIDPDILPPPSRAAVGVITSGAPGEKPRITGAKMDGAHPRAILAPVQSRPLLLGVEMAPDNDSGAAGRTRMGVTPPPPLSALARGTIALSDPILVSAAPGEGAPISIQETLTRMYGSTDLIQPGRLAVFWEAYGQNDGDTVDVALRIVHQAAGSALGNVSSAVRALMGLGGGGRDTISIRWREPRKGDPLAVIDSGVTIRPRGVALDVSALPAGDYTLEVDVTRKGVAVSSKRTFSIIR